jgi:hypothetical protein
MRRKILTDALLIAIIALTMYLTVKLYVMR